MPQASTLNTKAELAEGFPSDCLVAGFHKGSDRLGSRRAAKSQMQRRCDARNVEHEQDALGQEARLTLVALKF